MQGILSRCALAVGLEPGDAVAISIMVHLREVCATNERPHFASCGVTTATPDGRVGAQHMKRHSHVQSGLAISDVQWVIGVD